MNFRICFLSLVLFLTSHIAFSQYDSLRLKEIRSEVRKISTDTGYTIKTLDATDYNNPQATDGGSEVMGFFKDGQLVKITEWIGLSSCTNFTEFYLQDGQLIFSYWQGSEFHYDKDSGTFNPGDLDLTLECRFYFDKGKLLKSMMSGSTRCSGKPDESQWKEVLEKVERYRKLLGA